MIAQNIKHLRNACKLNQTDFGKLFGCSRGMIDSYEREIAKPSLDTQKAIAGHFKVSLNDLNNKNLVTGATNANDANIIHDTLKAKLELIAVLQSQVESLKTIIEDQQTTIKQQQLTIHAMAVKN